MSREGDLMRRSLKRYLIPELKALGFSGGTSSFQRHDGQWLDLLSLQYWKYGGEFILEFGRRERGPMHKKWGEVPEDKLEVAHLNPLDRARLEQRGSTIGREFRGFSFAGFGDDTAKYDELAKEVVGLLPQVDTWLRANAVGNNIHTFKPHD